MKSILTAPFFALLTCSLAKGATSLLLSEAVTTPTSDEFFEIYNPTNATINLDNYYVSDDEDYALLAGASGAGPAPSIGLSDFVVQFPAGSSILPGGVQVVAFDGASFSTTFAQAPDYEIFGTDVTVTDMISTNVGASAGFTNSGESLVLFYWDGNSDLVADIDMVNLGTPSASNDIGNKSGLSVDGPDAGTDSSTYANDAQTMPLQSSDPGFGFSTKRIRLEDGFQVSSGGNGLFGDDETTENIALTWDSSFTAPTPGSVALVPEPSVSGLAMVGLMSLVARRRR
ncbi:MAG: lamin tail domain-containing protein [Verrucomicrobiae bacterium]|nr:lamin tail domain-containing protein [Verrucomicrobiae bacterium]